MRTNVVPGVPAELFLERRRPGGNSTFPADGVDMGENPADERSQLREERSRDTLPVALHCGRVDHVDIMFTPGNQAPAKAQVDSTGVRRPLGQDRYRAELAIPFPAAGCSPRISPAVLDLRIGGDVDGERADVVVVDVVGRNVGHINATDKPLRRIAPREPGPLQCPPAVREVQGELQPEPGAFPHRIGDDAPPFGSSKLVLRFRLPDARVVAAGIQEKQSAEPRGLHRLQVGRCRPLVHIAIDPVPVAPGSLANRRHLELIKKRRPQHSHREHSQGQRKLPNII